MNLHGETETRPRVLCVCPTATAPVCHSTRLGNLNRSGPYSPLLLQPLVPERSGWLAGRLFVHTIHQTRFSRTHPSIFLPTEGSAPTKHLHSSESTLVFPLFGLPSRALHYWPQPPNNHPVIFLFLFFPPHDSSTLATAYFVQPRRWTDIHSVPT